MHLASLLRGKRLLPWALTFAAIAGLLGIIAPTPQVDQLAAAQCPPGYAPADEQPLAPDRAAELPPQYQGGIEVEWGDYKDFCLPHERPESFQDMAMRDLQFSAARTAPFTRVAPGAMSAAAAEREAMLAEPADVPGADGTWQKYGQGPLIFDDPRYVEANNTGIVDSTGRIDDLKYDAETNRMFAAIGTGGVWLSEDLGESWRPITDNMPTTVVSAVAYTPVGGPDGTVTVLTGESTFGGSSYVGIGAYYSRDLGETWIKSEGVPDSALGFAMEADPTNPGEIYAATGNGLWRSMDAGETYTDVVLPTGDCAGDYNNDTCNFANFVTDVVVQEPDGVGDDTAGGTVVAAVGWRAGRAENPDGTIQSEHNGLYRSETGDPGSFQPLTGLADAAGGQPVLGRMELGPATGPEQDHSYLYAIVEDAVLFANGPRLSPIPDANEAGLSTTVLNGIYVSPDFGDTWTLLADDNEIANSCTVNQSVYCLQGPASAGLNVTPGVQAWYDLWVLPDPTQQVAGVPSRLLFGIEEVWQSRANGTPMNTPAASFEVIGRYFGDLGCLFGQCVVNSGPDIVQTTHPDQHAAMILPTEEGPMLFVGHDGGLSRQIAGIAGVDDFDQDNWMLEQNNGLQTLLPYSTTMANDGVVYAGLQDNGTMRINPEDDFQQYETIGADGTFTAVDPENSDYAWESIQGGRMNVTTNGGVNWRAATPPADNKRFVNPFVMDPLDPNHMVTGGTQINESLVGPETANNEEGNDWETVFDLSGAPGVAAPVQQSAIDTRGDATYVGFCGVCDILNSPNPFQNGIATNVGGEEKAEAGTPNGWHFASAEGLPNRFITSVAIDPYDASQQTIYVTLGGYSRQWVPPGSVNDTNMNIGNGHVYKSTDAGETFTDISGNLPDMPATWVEPRFDQLLIATDIGVFISSDLEGGEYAPLGSDLPSTPVTSLQLKPDDVDTLVAGLYGRGVWTYDFPPRLQPGSGSDGGSGSGGGSGGSGEPGGPDTPGTPTTPPAAEVEVERFGGATRIETAIQTAQAVYDSAETVVVARADEYADALAGAPLAFRENAPLYLTSSDTLVESVAAEIDRLGATRAIMLGGEEALSAQVEEDLGQAGITEVVRHDGVNRFETAGLIAEEIGGDNVYITEGDDPDPAKGWPDAMSIAPIAAKQGQAILLVTTDVLPVETAAAIDRVGVTDGRIVGGTAAVSEATASALAEQITLGERIAGANRFATSVEAAEIGQSIGLSIARPWLARADEFADALTAGPSVAAEGGVLLLVSSDDLDNSVPTRDYLVENACLIETLRVLGGTAAISNNVVNQVRDLFSVCNEGQGPGGDGSGDGGSGDGSGDGSSGGGSDGDGSDGDDSGDGGSDGNGVGEGEIPPPPEPDPATGNPPEPDVPEPDGDVIAGPFGFEEDVEGWTAATELFTPTGEPGNQVDIWSRGERGNDGSAAGFQMAPYVELASTTLTSPVFENDGRPVFLDFANVFDVEGGEFDRTLVEYTVDGGETWTEFGVLGGQNFGYPEFSMNRLSFEPEAPGEFQVRFLFFSDAACSSPPTDENICARPDGYEGTFLDDILLQH